MTTHTTNAARPLPTPEERTSEFYNTVGWQTDQGVTEDARRFEDLRPAAADYVRACRLRVTRHVGRGGRILDMASGPIQYPEYLTYSAGYERRVCVDLSADALRAAEQKIGRHGEYLHGSWFDLEIPDDSFDAAVSLHTIYHIDAARQEEAVRKLLRVTKPGRPVIIVYTNPRSLSEYIRAAVFKLRRVLRTNRTPAPTPGGTTGLYFLPLRLSFFGRFRDVADVQWLPWRSLTADDSKALIPDNAFGRWMLRRLFALEDRFPRFFVRFGAYPMIILVKRDATRT